jgi:phosphoglycerate dehydrogenase-like enzyme
VSSLARRIVVAHAGLPETAIERIRSVAPEFELVVARQPTDEEVATAEVYAGHLTPAQIGIAGRLRWNHVWTAGADAVLTPEMLAAEGVALTTSAGNGAIPLAEHALLLMLMLDRDAPRWVAAQKARTWDRYRHAELAGQTVGIIGMGAAGRDLARKCAAFHMTVLGLRNRPEIPASDVERMYGPNEIADFAAQCDYVVVAAPLTNATRGMVDAAVFAAMKPTAAIVNISRGEIIDDTALRDAFSSGRISRAGLDAHSIEPLPEASPWWDQRGVIVTPHNGATTPATASRGVDIFLDNVERYAGSRPLRNLVDKASGYAG